jgi:hypothetical protein
MFTSGFAHQIIAPAADGQPSFVAGPVHWSEHLIAAHPVPLDALFAAVQLALGVGFLFRRTVPAAIVGSVAWAAGVWVFGEGLGGLLGGQASALIGAPGAALLYILLALASWPPGASAIAGAHLRPSPWVIKAWSVLWFGFAALSVLPANIRASATLDQLQTNAAAVPSWLGGVDRGAASFFHALGPAAVALLVTLEFAVGLLSLGRGRYRQVALWTGIALSALFWMVGQSFGLLLSGQSTDPNAGPLLVVLGLAAVGATRPLPSALPTALPAQHRTHSGSLAA